MSQQRQQPPVYYSHYPPVSQQPMPVKTAMKPVEPKHKVYVLYYGLQSAAPTIGNITCDSLDENEKDKTIRNWISTKATRFIDSRYPIKVLHPDLTIWRSYSIAVDIKIDPHNGTSTS